jgi:hypothetical protein
MPIGEGYLPLRKTVDTLVLLAFSALFELAVTLLKRRRPA